MPPLDSLDDVDASSPVRYGTEAFDQGLRHLLAEDEEQSGARILFYGGTREMRQQALATLTRYTTANVYQFRVPSLLAERRMQTQNALRKAFDHAAEESALLYFDSVDALLTHSHADTPDDADESALLTTAEYFFDRVVAYSGVVVLAFQTESHAERAAENVHLLVRFEQ